MAASSTKATLSSTSSSARCASIFSARRCTARRSTPAKGPPRVATLTLALGDFLGILEEALEPHIRERMLEKLLDHLERHRCHVRADERCAHEVDRMADAGREHFRLVVVIVVDGDDLLDQLHAVAAGIV